jgi:hypothetical protein
LFDFSAILQNDELGTSNLLLTQSKTLSRPDVLTNLPKTRPDVLTNLPKTKVHWVSDFFDLMWPEQSQIKSYPNYLSGIQRGFMLNVCLTFFFYVVVMTACLIPSKFVWVCCHYTSFCYDSEN